jgi:potassium/sodium efflux P-type ATPase
MATPTIDTNAQAQPDAAAGSIKSPGMPGADDYATTGLQRTSIGVGDDVAEGHSLKIHEKPIGDVIAELESDSVQGLSGAEAAKRFEEFGPNELEKPPRISLLMLFIVQLNSVIMYLLMGAVVASAAIKATGDDKDKVLSYVDSIAILIIVLINATIAAVTENSANDALEALSNLQSPMCNVIRDGNEKSVESRELVPGDVVKLGTGDVVPADVRCIKANDLRVNEMLLTGEPEDVAKNDKHKQDVPGEKAKLTPDNMAFSSSNVKAGTALCIVTSTGMKTRVGSIAALLNDASNDDDEEEAPAQPDDVESGAPAPPKPKKKKKEGCIPDTKSGQSPLQANLEKLAIKLGYMAIAVCTVVFAVGLLMNTKDPEDPDTPSWLFMILVSVTLTVAAIPEGLPLCVTIALSSGCASMVKENVLMRKIAAVETLGSASIICTDKTGTLTEGKMTLVAMYTGSEDFTVTGKGFDPTDGTICHGPQPEGEDATKATCVVATLGSAVLCSNTTLKYEDDPDHEGRKKWIPRGNSSEAPLVVGAQKVGIKLEEIEKSLERTYEIPFSSSRKMMMTITKTNGECMVTHCAPVGSFTAHVKGAPNYIMEKCTQYMAADGQIMPLDDAVREKYNHNVDELSSRALRVLAIAYRNMDSLPYDEEDDTDAKFKACAHDLTLCGMCASIDPERDGVKDAVKTAREAGCRVVMITGDYLKTAIAIGKNINILNKITFKEGNGEAVDCNDLRPGGSDAPYLSHADIDKMTGSVNVFARAKPEDKLEIVKSLQRQNFVCAMTGDGVNDAPALQRANIGVAMGLEGTEVAKGASDMILTDDNFCSIVSAIKQGRIIYAGIQKFVSFIMSVHFAEVVQIFLCIVSSVPVMRQPLQILFLILVTDLPPSIALGFEPGEAQIMKRAPRPKDQPVVVMWMWVGIVANGMILTICIFSTYMLALWAYAGAFLSDDITSDTRSSCSIWPETGQMTPSLDYDCGTWTACSTVSGNSIYKSTCSYPIASSGQSQYSTSYNVRGGGNGKDLADTAIAAAVTAGTSTSTTTSAIWTNHGDSRCDICVDQSIRRARTCAFISLVWAEGFRAYVSRSFENGFWVDTFSNPDMNKAVGLAQVTLFIALFLPGLSDSVLGLYPMEIHGFGWFLAIMGSLSCLVICEAFKCYSKRFVETGELAGYEEGEDGIARGSEAENNGNGKTVHVQMDTLAKPDETRACENPGRVCGGSNEGGFCAVM